MTFTPPEPAVNADSATWLTDRITWGDDWVTGTVGNGFPAYARIFHPLDDELQERWADVAERHGRVMHASAQWEHINSAVAPADHTRSGRGFPGSPDIGNLGTAALSVLCAVLRGHTETPEQCWFAVWDGWGWEHPGAHGTMTFTRIGEPAPTIPQAPDDWQLDLSAPTFSQPHREYLLYTGPIEAATRIGYWVTDGWFDGQSPSIFWPEDHSWCVATEIDFDSTLVGGTADLIAAVADSAQLEAVAIRPDAPYEDLINV